MADLSRKAVERFLAALTGDASTAVTWQTFDDRKPPRLTLARVLHGSLDECWFELCSLNRKGAGVFVTVNQTDGTGRKLQNVTAVRAVWVDLDTPELPEFPLPPNLVVRTARGHHCYWRVQPHQLTLDDCRKMNRMLATRYGGDLGSTDVARVLRVPGFLHQKSAKPVLVEQTL